MLVAAVTVVLAVMTGSPCRADEFMSLCRPYYGDACSAAIGAWLPRVFDPGLKYEDLKSATVTHVHDELVDPAGQGVETFRGQHEVYRGTRLVYGLAGPPKVRIVYDPAHRIAYFDEGCCSWHRVVFASDAAPPPKSVAERSLEGVHTLHGLRLGDSPHDVFAVFGEAPQRSGTVPGQTTIVYQRAIVEPKPYSSCVEYDTFIFRKERLRAMEFNASC